MKSIIKLLPLSILLMFAALPVSSIAQTLSPGTLSPSSKTINYSTSPGQITGTTATGGNGTYTYQWQSSPNNSTWTNIGGAAGLSYTPGNLTSTIYYRRSVTSNGITAYSNTVTINVYPQLLPGTITPASLTINYNSNPGQISGPSAAGGNGTYTYKWQSSLNNSSWTDIAGASGLNYSPANLTVRTYFRRVVTSNGASRVSNVSTINVYPRLDPGTLSPGSITVSYNTSPGLLGISTASGGNGTYSYLWQSSADKSNWNNIASATTKDYTPGSLTASVWYRRVVTSNGASIGSTPIYITVYQPVGPELDPYTEHTNINYIRTWEATAPEQDPVNLTGRPLRDVKQTTNYIDGLGRPIQSVLKQASLVIDQSPVDLVNSFAYDELGREELKYLPFQAKVIGRIGNVSDGSFKYNAFQQYDRFYGKRFTGEQHFYSQAKFEPSPSGRVEKEFAPGTNWVGTDRGIGVKYFVNTTLDDVKIWKVTNVAGSFGDYAVTGSYAAGELYKLIIIDEEGNQVIEFKDKEEKLILKKVQFSSEGDPGSGANHSGWYCTYYIYDELNNLRSVIQPRGVELISTNWLLTDPIILAEQCFRYEYDHHRSMIMKKVPGAGEVWMVYDARDRLVLTQDANLRAGTPVKWLYTQYDELNRPIETGLLEDNHTREYHAAEAANSIAYPNNLELAEELTKTYYDHYDNLPSGFSSTINSVDANSFFIGPFNTSPDYALPWTQSMQTTGLITWSITRVLGTDNFLTTVNYYDDKARVIQIQTRNVTGGISILSTQYDFSGQALKTVNRSVKAGTNPTTLTVCTKNIYDDLGRIIKIEKGLNPSGPLKPIIGMEYDELGQLKRKKLGTNPSGTEHLEILSYDYNIRGWHLGTNRSYLHNEVDEGYADHYFGFEVGYDKTDNATGSGNFVNPQYNGSISGTIWKSKGDQVRRKYDFEYDAVNRFGKATFTQNKDVSGSTWNSQDANFDVYGFDTENNSRIRYDANGNITGMIQKGITLGNPATVLDAMRYTNMPKSNKLQQVLDDVNNPDTKLGDFHYTGSKLPGDIDYTYDANGNLLSDRNKGISSIAYNHLNLQRTITSDKGVISYEYDLTGNKLKKTVTETGKPARTTLYLDGIVYENDTLKFVDHEEGRIRYAKRFYTNGTSSYAWVYDYFLKDHLNNVRMVLTEQKDTSQYMATMETAYRPYEENLFANIPQSVSALPSGYPADPTTNPNAFAAKVNGSGQKIGPAIILKVMAGDSIKIGVKSFYKSQSGTVEHSDPVADLISALANAIVGVSGEGKGTYQQLIETTSPLTGVLNSFRSLNNPDPPAGKPKAYLNWLVLDEQLKDIPAGSQSSALPVGSPNLLNPVPWAFKVNKNGYVYVYVSNETKGWDVYFDNLTVQHYTGPMLEETHYYPFGLTMAGISAKALKPQYTENKKKFVSQDFENELGWDMYQFRYRSHDPQIGRFIQIDPLAEQYEYNSTYAYAENKATYGIDLEGLELFPLPLLGSNPTILRGPLIEQVVKPSLEGGLKFAEIGSKTAEVGSKTAEIGTKTPKTNEHHYIPRKFKEDPLVESAKEGGFKFEGAENKGTIEQFSKATGQGRHGNHPKYSNEIGRLIARFKENYPNATPKETAEFLRNTIRDVKETIANNPQTKINDLFKSVLPPQAKDGIINGLPKPGSIGPTPKKEERQPCGICACNPNCS